MTTYSLLKIQDGAGAAQTLRSELASDGSLANHHVIEVGGSPVAAGANPFPVIDGNSAAWQGVVAVSPGTPTTPLRGLGYVCTAAGTITLTLADGSTIALPIAASPTFQSLPFAVGNLALSGGAAGTFWGLR